MLTIHTGLINKREVVEEKEKNVFKGRGRMRSFLEPAYISDLKPS